MLLLLFALRCRGVVSFVIVLPTPTSKNNVGEASHKKASGLAAKGGVALETLAESVGTDALVPGNFKDNKVLITATQDMVEKGFFHRRQGQCDKTIHFEVWQE